ncbi:MAG: methylmalonyl-CoA mutase family protein [Saprospiraceae bacterium]|nr:methylmalonyl-CoA mutase family protein [Candidatus Brachybacter algidus]
MTLNEQYNKWKENTLKKSLEKFKERKERFEYSSGLEVPRLSLPPEVDSAYEEKLGFPGEYPYTRGVQPTMYRSRFWTMRQYAGFSTAEESNKRYRYLLEQGQTGLSVAFDLPTQIGYDADDPIAQGEVGKVGVSISSIHDMMQLYDQIPLDKVSTSMTINAPAGVLLAMYIAVAKRQGADMRQLRGTIQNDILKEYVARGTYIFPPAPSMRLITDIFSFCAKEVPYWNTISISGYHIREAGSTAVQEVAFTLADGIAYVEAALKAGLDVDAFAGQLSFFFNAHNNLLEEVAKFRAARRMWARIMRERFKAKKPSSWQLRFHTQTAGSTLTAQQPENNVVRVTLQALSAVLGGTQSLHTNSMDEALWLPTEKSVRVALRTQQIIAYESGVADSIDPLAGSYLIEHLTDEIEKGALDYIAKIDEMGGALQSIERGYMQNEIQNAAYAAQQEIERKEQIVVGVNQFNVDEVLTLERLQVDPSIELGQREKLKKLRENRDQRVVEQLLGKLVDAAKGTDNLMPLFIECVENDITLGEICNTLRGVGRVRMWRKGVLSKPQICYTLADSFGHTTSMIT